MARLNSSVSHKPSSGLTSAGRRNQELISLFGASVVHQAGFVDIALLPLDADLMDNVHDAADLLLRLSAQPSRQRAMVAELPSLTRLVLCMWIMDMELAAKLVDAAGIGASR